MLKIILHTHILSDGIGDLIHLTDVCRFIQTNLCDNYEAIPVITFAFKQREALIRAKLANAGIANYYLSFESDTKQFAQNESLIRDFNEATQFIIISFSRNRLDEEVMAFLNPKAIRKYIGEHERYSTFSSLKGFSLGLSFETYGLKLQKKERLLPTAAYELFKKHDADFANDLLKYTHTQSADELFQNHVLIPAYFQKRMPLARLAQLLAVNNSLKTHFILSVSGGAGDVFSDEFESVQEELGDSVALVYINHKKPAENRVLLEGNARPKIIYIFDDYQLSDLSYQAMYRQSSIAGISGDNSLEEAISLNSLIFYHSTNDGAKSNTLKSLVRIIESEIDLPDQVKQDFIIYFKKLPEWCAYRDVSKLSKVFSALDLSEMIKQWPKIVDHLFQYYNFYNKLKDIIEISDADRHEGTIKSNFLMADSLERLSIFNRMHSLKPASDSPANTDDSAMKP